MKLSNYIVQRLADWGVRHIFLVTGGGAMHLNDSIGHESRIPYVCNHHEQLPDSRIVSPTQEDMYPFLDETELTGNVIQE
jgi:hypothetical protein